MQIIESNHANMRSRQRGFKRADMDLILRYGTQTKDGVLLTRCDTDEAIRNHKAEIADLERLTKRQAILVIADHTIVTAYGAKNWKTRRQLENRMGTTKQISSTWKRLNRECKKWKVR